MKTNQRSIAKNPTAVPKKSAGRCKRVADVNLTISKRSPRRYQYLEGWLFANMTAEQLQWARIDCCLPEGFMTKGEAIELLDRFADEIRDSFNSRCASEELVRMDDESCDQHAQRLVEYALCEIMAWTLHDDMGDVSEFLAGYQS